MPIGCITFGPNESYFFSSPTKWTRSGLPDEINNLFTQQNPIREVYDLAISPDGDSWFIAYLNHERNLFIKRRNLPQGLNEWLVPKPGKGVDRDIASLSISLGPNQSYFAFDKNGASWANLPSSLREAIAERRNNKGSFKDGKFPQSVSFGPDGTYVSIDLSGGPSWSRTLEEQCPRLDGFLANANQLLSFKGTYVVLDQHIKGDFVMVLNNGQTVWNVRQSMGDSIRQFDADWSKHARKRPQSRIGPSSRRTELITHNATEGLYSIPSMGV